MPSAFNFSISPFDALSPEQQRALRASLDIAYYPEGQLILDSGAEPAHLWVNIKGHVAQYEGDELVSSFGPEDVWDGRALVSGRSSHRFVASEELIAYQIPRATVLSLIAENATFGALLFADLGAKLSALAERTDAHELHSLVLSRVDEAFLRPAHTIDADADVFSAVHLLHTHDARALLVQDVRGDSPTLGIFTNSAVQRAVLDGRPLQQLKVRDFSRFPLIAVQPGDTLGDALALLTRHRIHRLVVTDGPQIKGLLEAMDVFSFLAGHSHQIALQIEAASDMQALTRASGQTTRMVARLHRSGTRVALIARLVQDLQARLFERAWQLLAPPDLQANSCLFVMGSEGRAEQLLKTDQDNGLILANDYTPPANLQDICEAFSQALVHFGYPPCPGGIMVSRSDWRGSVDVFSARVRAWLLQPDGEALMHLGIFLDAHAVAGDASLLAQVLEQVRHGSCHTDAALARFAAAVDAFGEHGGWWSRWLHLGAQDQGMDLKKEGLFPLVHGVRSLAWQAGLGETSTAARLQALAARGVVSAADAADWTECLHLLMGLKLKAGLDELAREQPVSGVVRLDVLSTLERDLLKDALAEVRRLREFLRRHFRLDVL